MGFTLVSVHAHPDDEALLTAGTLARAAADGHRVVLVVATSGARGEAPAALVDRGDLGRHRLEEVHASARALGVSRVVCLNHPDSGLVADPPAPGAPSPFALLDREEVAAQLAEILREERADAVTIYDPRGGYGHPDHVQVSLAGARAAELAGTPVVLEATADRDALVRAARWIAWLPGIPGSFSPRRLARTYTPRAHLTHRVDVSGVIDLKRAAMAAHQSQAQSETSVRTLAVFLALPRPLFRLAFRNEWYVERGRAPGRLLDDIFASLRGATPEDGSHTQ